jgi:hypothetical protein
VKLRHRHHAFYESASARDLARMETLWAHEPHVRAIHPTDPRGREDGTDQQPFGMTPRSLLREHRREG